MKLPQSRRKITNVKLTAKYHAQFMGWWIILSIFQLLAIDALLFLVFRNNVIGSTPAASGSVLDILAAHSMFLVPLGMITLLLLSAVVSLAILTAHRIAGPYIALRRTFNAIKAGDLNVRLRFRSYDNMDDVATPFNEMMDSLSARLNQTGSAETRLKVVGE